ncbi:MAG: TPM domain-containing protein [Candidatus Saganbacteria bacterium]|nr:TPM domain-containing protein [Candidatus Saganbacteria bacterium]
MKCPKCNKSIPEWKKGCECGYKFDFSRIPAPPKQSGLVNDYEAILGDHIGKLIQLCGDFEKRAGIEIVIAVFGNTKPLSPENYAFFLFNKWKLGKNKHEAILILVALYERRIETEIGFGLEPLISEEFSEKLLDDIVVPYFKKSKYGEGLYEGVKALIKEIDSRSQGVQLKK